MKQETRVSPYCCQSAQCGKGPSSCPPCRNFPVKQEFDEWKVRTKAIQEDPVWCPSVWTAQEEEGRECLAWPVLARANSDTGEQTRRSSSGGSGGGEG